MATWKASRVAEGAVNNIQVDAGVFLKGTGFDPANPKMFNDADILLTTTGSPSINCVPSTSDWFADVNGAPNNSAEGKHVDSWDCSLGGTALDIDADRLALYLGSSQPTENGLGIKPKFQYSLSDFKDIWALFDMADPTKLFAVKLKKSINTAGLAFSANKNGKGTTGFTFTGHSSMSDPEDVPMEFYVLTKADGDPTEYVYTAVEPVGTENPREEGWYILIGDVYVLTSDTTVDSNKTYYERTESNT